MVHMYAVCIPSDIYQQFLSANQESSSLCAHIVRYVVVLGGAVAELWFHIPFFFFFGGGG